jgi:hypothetical protein
VDYGTPVTRAVKNGLFAGTGLLYRLSGRSWNPSPAITAFARKPVLE